jgi:DNA-binding transcriptional regulator YiaG
LTGKAIKEIRLHLNLDSFDFAELIGVTVSTVERWEKTKGLVHLQSRTFTAIRRVATGKLRK